MNGVDKNVKMNEMVLIPQFRTSLPSQIVIYHASQIYIQSASGEKGNRVKNDPYLVLIHNFCVIEINIGTPDANYVTNTVPVCLLVFIQKHH